MGVRVLPEIIMEHAKQMVMMMPRRRRQQRFHQSESDVPRGHFAVYVGDEDSNRRFVVPVAYLDHPLFQDLLNRAADEFGYAAATRLIVPCPEHEFRRLTSQIVSSRP